MDKKELLIMKNINEFLSIFPYPKKNNYDWKIKSASKSFNNEKNKVFYGENKNNKNDCIYVKQINIKTNNLKVLKSIYKEVFILLSLKDKHYFPKNVSLLTSKNNNFIFLIFEDNTAPLKNIMENKEFNLENDLLKWIIYQITFGLYVLHSKNIIHHDIKSSNIIINGKADISIIDFGSAIFKGENSFEYTLSYAAPEFLFKNDKMDEKFDMWSLGVIILELYNRKANIFESEEKKDKKGQLEFIFGNFGINENYTNQDLIKILNENKNINFKIPQCYLDKIQDKDAKYLVKNLLVFNPNRRFSALDVLNSKYLSECKKFDSLEIDEIIIPNDYQNISQNNITGQKFVDLIRKMQ